MDTALRRYKLSRVSPFIAGQRRNLVLNIVYMCDIFKFSLQICEVTFNSIYIYIYIVQYIYSAIYI